MLYFLYYFLNKYVKLLLKFPSKRNIIEEDILNYQKSFYCEVQQRAVEYKIFDNIQKDDLKKRIVNSIPIPKNNEENNKKREIINENDEEENNKDDDPKTSIKISSINIQESSNQVNDMFQGNENNNNNNNTNENKNSGGLNLLDLNNIFGNNTISK